MNAKTTGDSQNKAHGKTSLDGKRRERMEVMKTMLTTNDGKTASAERIAAADRRIMSRFTGDAENDYAQRGRLISDVVDAWQRLHGNPDWRDDGEDIALLCAAAAYIGYDDFARIVKPSPFDGIGEWEAIMDCLAGNAPNMMAEDVFHETIAFGSTIIH